MRAFEFKTTILESAVSPLKSDLNKIKAEIKTHPENAKEVNQQLDLFNDSLRKAIERLNQDNTKPAAKKPAAKTAPTNFKPITPPSQLNQPDNKSVESLDEELVDEELDDKRLLALTDAKLSESDDLLDALVLAIQKQPMNVQKKLLNNFMKGRYKEVIKDIYETASDDVHQDTLGYESEQGDAIALLAGKVTGTLEKIKDHYNHKAALFKKQMIAPETPEEKAAQAEEIAQIEKTLSRSQPNTSAIADEIKTLVTGTLEWWKRKHKEKKAREEFNKESLKFIRACEVGIIDLGDLLNKGSGNFIDEIPDEYSWVRETKLVDQLLKLKPSGSGAGNWGPGEMGLAILGKPVNKDSTKGDLVVGDKKFELKASASAKSGGRINTEAVMVGKDGQVDFLKAWDAFSAKLAPGSIVLDGEKIAFANLEDKPKNIRSKNITRTSIGPTWIAIVNGALKRSKVSSAEVSSFLGEVLTAPISPSYKDKVKYNTSSMVTTEGGFPQIDDKELLGDYLRQVLEFYNQTDEVEDILVVNPSDGHFEVINATDSKGLQKKINTGAIQTSTTWIDFADKQSKATPQLGTATPK